MDGISMTPSISYGMYSLSIDEVFSAVDIADEVFVFKCILLYKVNFTFEKVFESFFQSEIIRHTIEISWIIGIIGFKRHQ